VSSARLPLVLLIASAGGAAALPAAAETRAPQDAVAAVKRVLVRNEKPCRLDWAKIRSRGYADHWKVTVTVRSSLAGAGAAHWTIGGGAPVAADARARQLTHGCSAKRPESDGAVRG
jgi:hypothetical protein